jgi:peptidoglycan/LPS O-acetylase OafA/YrhL
VLVLGLLSLASLAFHQQIVGDRALSVLGTFYLFALGMALAVLSVGRDRDRARQGPAWARSAPLAWAAATGLFALICTRPEQSPVWPPYALVALLLVLPAVFAADRRDPVRDVLRDPRAMWVGLVSYGVYLWHRPLVEQLNAKGLDGSHWSHFVTGVTATIAGGIALGAASYYVVERPALRLKRSVPARR